MSDHNRKTGFLQPKERSLLYELGCYPIPVNEAPPKGVAQTKSRLKNQVAKASTLREVVTAFENDLFALYLYHRKADEDQQIVWQNVVLERVAPELKQLRGLLDELIDRAESNELWNERAELQAALAELYAGPEPLKWVGLGAAEPDGEDPVSPEELEREYLEMRDRQAALNEVLRHSDWANILEYLDEHGKTRLPKKFNEVEGGKQAGEPWNRIAGRELVKHGLVEKTQLSNRNMEFELTPRGEAVVAAWLALKETDPVQTVVGAHPDRTAREATLDLLANHFGANFEK